MWSSAETRARLEPWVLAALVLIGAVSARYLQADASTYTAAHLEEFGRVSGISVEGWPEHPFFINWVGGDGQVFAAFAVDPLYGGGRVRYGAYRFTRVGYSLVVAAVTLGRDHWVPYGLVAVNAAAVLAVTYLAFRHRETYGPRVWWLLANPALYLGFLQDTAEPLAIALLAGALVSGSAMLAACLAVVRPSFLVGAAKSPRLLLVGGVVALLVRLFAGWLFEASPTEGVAIIGWPLAGYMEASSVTGWGLALAGGATLVLGVLRRQPSWVLSGLLVWMFGTPILDTEINAVRAAGMLPVVWALDPEPAELRAMKKGSPRRALASSS